MSEQLISVQHNTSNNTHQLLVHESTLNKIRALTGPIHVLCVAGSARLGKSTLCNIIMRHYGVSVSEDRLFKAQGGSTTVTAGIWISTVHIPCGGGSLVIIDTEGTDRGEDEVTLKLSALGCYLSSVLVLVVANTVNNAHLRSLIRLRGIGDMIQQTNTTPAEQQQFTPALCVLSTSIGDGWFDEELNRPVDQVDFSNAQTHAELNRVFENGLAEVATETQLNQIKQAAKNHFPNRSYHVLLTPERQDRSTLVQSRYEPNTLFGKSVVGFLGRLQALGESNPKKLQSGQLTTQEWCDLCVCMVNQSNRAKLNLVTAAHEIQLKKVVALIPTIVQSYQTSIQSCTTIAMLDSTHNTASSSCMNTLQSQGQSIATQQVIDQAKAQLTTQINSIKLTTQQAINARILQEQQRQLAEQQRQAEAARQQAAALEAQRIAAEQQRVAQEQAQRKAMEQKAAQEAEQQRLMQQYVQQHPPSLIGCVVM